MAKAIESIESPTPKEGVGWGCGRGRPTPRHPPDNLVRAWIPAAPLKNFQNRIRPDILLILHFFAIYEKSTHVAASLSLQSHFRF